MTCTSSKGTHQTARMLIWAFAGCICSKIRCRLEFSVATNTDFKSDLKKRPLDRVPLCIVDLPRSVYEINKTKETLIQQ